MGIASRIQKIREIRGMNKKIVAAKMNISAQTYSLLEKGDNLKYSTIIKFCEVVEVDLSILLAEDVPMSVETIEFFDSMKGKSFLLSYEQLKQKVDVYSEVINAS